MNKYVKAFLHRGLIFGGFGPIVTAIVYFIISLAVENVVLNSTQILTITISTYTLAFIHAGASVFNRGKIAVFPPRFSVSRIFPVLFNKCVDPL